MSFYSLSSLLLNQCERPRWRRSLCLRVCALTEVSQAGQGGGLQPAVVREGVAGPERHPLDTIEHQDAVVALCGATHETKHTFRPQGLSSYMEEIFPSKWINAITH